jgi:hypothetical protein
MGAELDVKATVGTLSAELDLIAGAVKKGVEQAVTVWRAGGSPVAKRMDVSGTVTAAQAGLATPTAFFAWSIRPQVGRLWSIRKIVLQATGGTAFSASALANVTAAIFVTGQPGGGAALANNPPFQDADVTGLTFPTTQYFSANQLWVRGQEWLVVGIQGTGVTAGLQVQGTARGIEIDDNPIFLLDI